MGLSPKDVMANLSTTSTGRRIPSQAERQEVKRLADAWMQAAIGRVSTKCKLDDMSLIARESLAQQAALAASYKEIEKEARTAYYSYVAAVKGQKDPPKKESVLKEFIHKLA